MNINLHNYEAFFLDHIEGSLSAEQEAELMAFLQAHPELRAELEEFEELPLEPSTLSADFKQQLKVDVAAEGSYTDSLSDDLLIGELEGTLNPKEQQTLAFLLEENPVLEADRKLYANTTVEADTSVVYPGKEKLKRRGVIIPLYTRIALGLAAAIALLFGVFQIVEIETQPALEGPTLATVETPIVWKGSDHPPLVWAGQNVELADNSGTPWLNAIDPVEAAPQTVPGYAPSPEQRSTLLASEVGQPKSDPIPTVLPDGQEPPMPEPTLEVDPSALAHEPVEEPKMEVQEPQSIQDFAPATVSEALAMADSPAQQPQRFFTLRELAVRGVKKRVAQENEPKPLKEKLTFANAVNFLGKVTGTSIHMEEEFDEEGNRDAFTIGTRGFEYTKETAGLTRQK